MIPAGAVELRLSCARVAYASVPARGETDSWDDFCALFTAAERASSTSRDAGGLAGRLAAKHAVAGVLQAQPVPGVLARIRIAAAPRAQCREPARCARGHPPAAVLAPGPPIGASGQLSWLDVSISHDAGDAFAAAVAIVRPLGG